MGQFQSKNLLATKISPLLNKHRTAHQINRNQFPQLKPISTLALFGQSRLIVGSEKAIAIAVKQFKQQQRYTRLRERLESRN